VTLILGVRNHEVDAVVGLDGSYGFGPLAATLTGSPWYQPSKFRLPLLDIRRDREALDLKPIEALVHSERYHLQFPGLMHSDFTSFAMIANRVPSKVRGRNAENAARAYEIVCRYILAFLNAFVKKDAHALHFINSEPEENGIPQGILKFARHPADTEAQR
jgi:hypothetical protein